MQQRQSSAPAAKAAPYTPVSDVVPQQNLSLDIRDIGALMNPPDNKPVNWAAARAVYDKGGNSKEGDGSARTLASVATNPKVLAQFPNGAKVLGNASFLDATVRSAIDGTARAKGVGDKARKQLVDKAILAVIYGEILEELEAAQGKVKEGKLDNAKGAPHNVDEAWAYYTGAKDAKGEYSYALCSTAGKRERNFKIEGRLDIPLQKAIGACLQAAQKGDAASMDKAVAQTKGYINAIFYLASLRYMSQLVADTDPKEREVHLAEGWGFFQTLRPAVAVVSSSGADTVEAVYAGAATKAVTAQDVTRVYAALNSPAVLQALNIPKDLVMSKPPA